MLFRSNMKKSLFILAILFSHCAFSQNFTNSDVIKTFKGLTPEYQKYFNELEELIGKENYDNIMFKNAKRVFNIKHIFTF